MSRPIIECQITFLYTTNLDKTTHFYEDILELEPALDQGKCIIYRVSGDGYLGFCQKSDAPIDKSTLIFTIVTSEVDEWYDFLKEKGVVFDKEPEYNPNFNIYHTMFRDPDGYLIEIQSFRDPRW
jgi:catechol 2,3-dioxygenase-like lactoylglutathione lyase family enzyme